MMNLDMKMTSKSLKIIAESASKQKVINTLHSYTLNLIKVNSKEV